MMLKYLKRSLVISISLAMLAGDGSSAGAYVLQGPHLLELMVGNLGKAKRLLVSQTVFFSPNDSRTEGFELNETARYRFPEEFRSDIFTEKAQRIHVSSKGEAVTVIDGKISADPETRFDCYKDILLYHSRMLLERRLSALGVNVSVSSLGRFQNQIAYVLGAEYPDESVTQVWIDQETFRPFRWLIIDKTAAGGNDSMEIQYLDWQPVEAIWYPMRIVFYQSGDLVREVKVNSIRVDPLFAEDFFNIKHLKSVYKPAAPAAPAKREADDLDEVQKTIEEFKKVFE